MLKGIGDEPVPFFLRKLVANDYETTLLGVILRQRNAQFSQCFVELKAAALLLPQSLGDSTKVQFSDYPGTKIIT